MLMGQRRIGIENTLDPGPPMSVLVDHLEHGAFDANDRTIKAYSNEIINVLRDVVQLNPLFKEHMQYFR